MDQFAALDIGTPQLLILLGIVVLLFGGKKLPELSRSIGESMQELKKGVASTNDLKSEVKKQVTDIKTGL